MLIRNSVWLHGGREEVGIGKRTVRYFLQRAIDYQTNIDRFEPQSIQSARLSFQSSESGPPPPSAARECCSSPLWVQGGGTLAFGGVCALSGGDQGTVEGMFTVEWG
jgi:hypothetical protein